MDLNGPPLAVKTRRFISLARPDLKHCAMAECSLSTGTICPGFASLVTALPPMTNDSLLASAKTEPDDSAATVGSNPTAPVMPLTTTSTGTSASSVAAFGPINIFGSVKLPSEYPAFFAWA